MKKFSKILVVLFMLFTVGGCNNKECNCPSDTDGDVTLENKSEYPDLSKAYYSTVKNVVLVRLQKKSNGDVVSTGSGVVAFEEGDYAYVYTNAHVIKDLTSDHEIEIFFSDEEGDFSGASEIATVMGKDYNEDVAVLEIRKSTKYKVAKLGDSYNVKETDVVYTTGSPLGIFNTFTAGRVSNVRNATVMESSTGLKVTAYDSILFYAPINPGNSGGALFNKDGELIGITTLKYKDTSGMNVALSIDYFSKVAKYLLVNNTSYVRPSLSLSVKSIDEMGVKRADYGISDLIKTGVYVQTSLEPLIPTQIIITEVNGVKVKSVNRYNVELLKYNVGDTVTLTITNRDGLNVRNVSVVLH